MLDILTTRNVLPLRNNCVLYLPLVNSLSPSVNRTNVPVTSSGIEREPNGYYRFINRDHIKIPDDLGIGNEFTLGAWFKRMGDPDYADNSGFYHIVFGDVAAELSISPDFAIRCGVRINGVRYVQNLGVGLVSTSEWTHVSFTYRNGVGIDGYINGSWVGNFATPSGVLDIPLGRKIGEYNTDSYGSNAYYRGAYVYNRVLTMSQIRRLLQSSRP